MAYIKTHSNYVLRKEHQRINDGTIYERNFTTIGGVNQFAPNQTPIYKSGNFIITVRDDGKVSNQFNSTKWESSNSGNVWTLENIAEMSSEFEDQNDVKIVLKQDYYDFRDFVYYGSLTEMFRASITDILSRFPGELYVTNENAYYTSGVTVDSQKMTERVLLGKEKEDEGEDEGEVKYYVDNPFGINIYSTDMPSDGNPLKYFANEGYKNYQIIIDESNSEPVDISKSDIDVFYYTTYDEEETDGDTEGEKEIFDGRPACIGELSARVTLHADGVDDVVIEAWVGDRNEIVYLSQNKGVHIRPKELFIAEFYNKCDNFQKILLDRNTTPKYKSIFSVIKETPRGYIREMETFIFPTSYGDYNINANSDFMGRLVEIGEFYDDYFTDNMYRSMTHEAIKNFDWSYTREFLKGDEDDYVQGGQKVQKALRIFAREFDEILSYIDNIKNVNRVTYDGRNNLPNYFLVDEVENKGWDVKMTYPYELKEIDKDGNEFEDYTEEIQLTNSGFTRHFSQNTKCKISPYSASHIEDEANREGYFITCCESDDSGMTPCYYKNTSYEYIDTSGKTTYYDECKKEIRNRIKAYSDEKPYSYMDINNEFLRRLAINSTHIFRHKGTIEGIEMILAMFGLKSRRWVEKSMPDACKEPSSLCSPVTVTGPSVVELDEKGNATADYQAYMGKTTTSKASNSTMTEFDFDYEIIEYSSVAEKFEDKWDPIHQMYRMDWVNSTKTIVYDNAISYNDNGYIPYQGLPVSWRYDESKEMFIKNSASYINDYDGDSYTSAVTEAFIDKKNNPVRRRWLYPNFNKHEQLDGNPYFQMNGGWLAKSIEEVGSDKAYYFQYDADDNMAYSETEPIYKETVRNIRRVDSISDLLKTPVGTLKNGAVFYVSNLKDVAVVNNTVYDINQEYYNGKTYNYISLVKNDSYIQIGSDRFFNDMVYVYDRSFASSGAVYSILDKSEGYTIKAYFMTEPDETDQDETDSEGTDSKKNKKPQFICKADSEGYYEIEDFMVFHSDSKGKVKDEEGNEIDVEYTNYFILDDTYYSNRMASDSNKNNGWRRLTTTDPDYIRINTITNYYEGNNPHNGNMVYDNGREYFTYFSRLFKHALDNDLFDERCYEAFYYDADNEVSKYGFSGLIDEDETIKDYSKFLIRDSKIHYFGNYYPRPTESDETDSDATESGVTKNIVKNLVYYGENKSYVDSDKDRVSALTEFYSGTTSVTGFTSYCLGEDAKSDEKMIFGNPYVKIKSPDEVTDQIVNNKRLTIIFYIDNIKYSEGKSINEAWYSKESQCGIKYIDDIVMNYLTQMIPSTTIVDIKYVYRGEKSND